VESFQLAHSCVSSDGKLFLCRFVLSEWQKRDPPGRFVKAGVGEASDDEVIAWISALLGSLPPLPKAEDQATKTATLYFKQLMESKYDSVPDFPGMEVIRDKIDLETYMSGPIVVRSITKKFGRHALMLLKPPQKTMRNLFV
jgi:hypothetical protein